MEFEKWLESYEIDAAKLDEKQMAALKAAWERGEEPPTFEAEEKTPAQKAEKKVQASASRQEASRCAPV